MGCRTRGYKFGVCSGTGVNTDHCDHYTPSSGGVTFEFQEYPQNVILTIPYDVCEAMGWDLGTELEYDMTEDGLGFILRKADE